MLHDATPLATIFLGLTLGMRHATDPDHVVAITTILGRECRLAASTRIGLLWGMGHSLTVMLVGTAIIVLKLSFPVRLNLAMELTVAIALILLGAGATTGLLRRLGRHFCFTRDNLIVHSHPHAHDEATPAHPHIHHDHSHDHLATPHDRRATLVTSPAIAPRSFAARRPLMRSFGVGLVHGLAGSAAIALMVLAAIPTPLWAALYLVIFCVGTMLGMSLITTAIAAPLIVAGRRIAWVHQAFVTGAGVLSFGFGLLLAYRIGIIDGLLTF